MTDVAWGIVELMIRMGAAVSIYRHDGGTCVDTDWQVTFASPGFRGDAFAKTVVEAIVKAATRAIEDMRRCDD